ncbi:DUF4913 domain-containing protein [Streptomyces sp. CB03911]|uniref:DUF4913 domain-containing protein n=1 Tax=Streptomyces sp. CB03911 TaxID=1804758 RepID=UPI00093A591A|nr:DUF4913 domain-containing protein [Streptomyces sp. CB03911]OKI25617.1 hypothetical protein A6A07_30595 [Streptomyces sp. CB03911]
MSAPIPGAPEPESIRLPDDDLDDLVSALHATMAEVRQHGVILDRLASEAEHEPEADTAAPPIEPTDDPDAAAPLFILAMGGAQYEAELAELSLRVTHIPLPVHDREIGSIRPWCAKWHEHPEAVARLHGLWLARQQLAGAEAGLAAPSTWHRDHLDHTFLQLRAPAGPFAACTTSPGRPADRR